MFFICFLYVCILCFLYVIFYTLMIIKYNRFLGEIWLWMIFWDWICDTINELDLIT